MITAQRNLLFLFLVMAAGMRVGPVWASEIEIERVETRLKDDHYLLDARINYQFSDKALEALDNGVPLTLDLHLKLERLGAWFWEEPIVDTHLRSSIRFHALAETYQVLDHTRNLQHNFVTRDAALSALGEINELSVVDAVQLNAEGIYQIRLKTSLDIEALPLPLRPLAYLQPAWKLSSGWSLWPLEP